MENVLKFKKEMMVPRVINHKLGYDSIMPFVTKEDEKGNNQSGLIINKGWIPE